jgi:hypothetical protein
VVWGSCRTGRRQAADQLESRGRRAGGHSQAAPTMSKIAEGVPGPSSGLPLRTQSEENHMNLGALFKVIDTDTSGTIDLHEFKLAW